MIYIFQNVFSHDILLDETNNNLEMHHLITL